jgi:hypothetical protein
MNPGKDASNRLKFGTAFLYSAAICMRYRQIGCAKSVVNYRMSKLLKPAFAAQIHSDQRWVPSSHVLRAFHTMGLAAHTMGLSAHTMGLAAHTMGLVAHTIGLAARLEDGLVWEFLVMFCIVPIHLCL